MTEYRIVECRTEFGDLYLQFKRKYTISVFKGILSWFCLGKWIAKQREDWRFVPEATAAITRGSWLNSESCPVRFPKGYTQNFLHCFRYQEWDLKKFTKEYPDIELYFEHLRKERKRYLGQNTEPPQTTEEE